MLRLLQTGFLGFFRLLIDDLAKGEIKSIVETSVILDNNVQGLGFNRGCIETGAETQQSGPGSLLGITILLAWPKS